MEYQATEEAFNGTYYPCSQCDRTFRTIRGQGSTSRSTSTHRPTTRENSGKCGLEVTLVSGLVQHIESGMCDPGRWRIKWGA
ncbi:hypothetical protein K443DRAFT_677806 [Laccaria amethystina LaAM-08-1]|uniref:C2H2-type domain-containing protein n=1 Tax=Laccaria amethystina LaAM-08-1 TaxID=1095629 RepID=A0A0C9WT62_9AGAR|nr:hypothetical protein K443DRAFT_677806 [Laccaria amethystina LaAM-08-1]